MTSNAERLHLLQREAARKAARVQKMMAALNELRRQMQIAQHESSIAQAALHCHQLRMGMLIESPVGEVADAPLR